MKLPDSWAARLRSKPARAIASNQKPEPGESSHFPSNRTSSRVPTTGWAAPSREHVILASLGLGLATLIISVAPGLTNAMRAETSAVQTVELPLPELAIAPEPTHAAARETLATVQIEPGQTLGEICGKLGISPTDLHRLLEHPGASGPLTRIRAGAEFEFEFDAEGKFVAVRFDKDDTTRTELRLSDAGVSETTLARDVQRRTFTASGEISQSLFAAGAEAGMTDATLLELANVFSYDIDFAQDIRVGDRFTVVYDEVWRDGERLRSGNIIAASFTNQGKRFHAFRYARSDGREDYFDGEGRPIKKSFLRMPIEFARISSRFNPSRRHPVLGTIRAHKGVDYAAVTGTPIRAAGDGRVSFAGWKGGYGRAVILDHGNGYTTLYGHLSRLGRFKTGSRVRQGEVIGQVGSSGLATGPHLHYEFRVKGVHRDPLKVTLPKPEPLPATELARFRAHTGPMLAQLQLLEGRRFAMAH